MQTDKFSVKLQMQNSDPEQFSVLLQELYFIHIFFWS